MLLLLLLLLEVMLGPRIWRVELLRRRAMPQDRLLLLLQGRRGRSTGRSHGLRERRRGVGTLLAACMTWVSKVDDDMAGLVSGGRLTARKEEGSEGGTGDGRREGLVETRRLEEQLTRVRDGGGEVVCVLLLVLLMLLMLLHEAIVEVWRRRSGVVVLTGIVRVWCRLGLVLALALAAVGGNVIELLRVEGERAPSAAGSAGKTWTWTWTWTSNSNSRNSVRSRVERSLVF